MFGKPIDIGDLTPNPSIRSGLPFGVGVGLKRDHLPELRANPDQIKFVEVHAENFMDNGPQLELLKDISDIWPVSIHGVALSLGGEDPLDQKHLDQLKHLIDTIEPASFSEHIAWSCHNGIYYNDLFPIPYNRRRLYHLADRIDRVQQFLGTRILVENPSSYVRFQSDTMHEADFIAELVDLTSCGLLLDVNNLYVSAQNHGWDAKDWLSRIPIETVGEIHLAGHEQTEDDNGNQYLLDTHGAEVDEPVWSLYCDVLAKAGPCPTLIERDNNIPPLETLLGEVASAQLLIDAAKERSS